MPSFTPHRVALRFINSITRSYIVFFLIFALFFATRLVNLLVLPIFSDEGIYIGWAKIAANDPAWRFISLIDGKQPLQTWGTIPLIKLFPDNLLFAGRLFSVGTGFFALMGVITLCWYLWGKRAGIVAGLFYVACPFFLFYDRLALVDSGVNAAFIWILLFSIVLAQKRRLDIALVFGFTAGTGLLAKSSLFLFVGLSAGAVLLMLQLHYKHFSCFIDELWKKRKIILVFYSLFVLVCVIAGSMYLTQKFFSPFFHYIGQKNLTFILSPKDWLANPFALMKDNISLIPLYVAWESGWILVPLGILGWFRLKHKQTPLAWYFFLWLMVPYLLIANFNKVLYPRYLIFFPSLFLIFSTYAIISTTRKSIMRLMWGGTLIILTAFSVPIVFNPQAASLPPIDRGQYIEGSTAVWGAEELMQTVRESTRSGKRALILAEGNFGLIADVLTVYIKPNDHIDVRGLWPLNEEHIIEAQKEERVYEIFVVFSHRKDFPVHWREIMTLVKKYEKPNNSPEAVYMYKLKPYGKTP